MAAISNRINTLLLVLVLLALLALIAMVATRASGGPLDPPGAPAPTDGVRHDGTPISSLPFTITQRGAYYVTRDLAGAVGITINADFVTLDLQGFTLTGPGTGGTTGILVFGSHGDLEIRNGMITGWTDGLAGATAIYSRVDGLRANGNGTGISIGTHSVIQDCDASGNTVGIVAASSVVRQCNVTDSLTNGIVSHDNSLIEDNRIRNGPYGIWVIGNRATIRRNEITNSSLSDIYLVAPAAGVVLRENVLTDATHFFGVGSGYRVLFNSCHDGLSTGICQ